MTIVLVPETGQWKIGLVPLEARQKRREMPRKQHRKERIIYAHKQIEWGSKGLEICRELGISEQTLYNWKRKYNGLGASGRAA